MTTDNKKFFAFIAISIIAWFLLPFIGSQPLDFRAVFNDRHSLDGEIFFSIRLPRVVFAFFVGAGLSLIGSVFQALLRNDLATPYTLGVSSGGAFGAVLALKLNLTFSLFIFSAVGLLSITGSLLSIAIIYFIARNRKGISIFTLILAGVAISFFFSSFNLFLHYMADFTETYRMIRWLMGSLDISNWQYTVPVIILVFAIFFFFFRNYQAFNIILAGEEVAISKGVEVERLQKLSFFLGSVTVGFIVALAGPIGFVGLVVPHVIRLLFGANHKYVFSGSLLGGGVFLAACDTVARTIIAPAELPVGIITAMLGGPFFVYLLIKRK